MSCPNLSVDYHKTCLGFVRESSYPGEFLSVGLFVSFAINCNDPSVIVESIKLSYFYFVFSFRSVLKQEDRGTHYRYICFASEIDIKL